MKKNIHLISHEYQNIRLVDVFVLGPAMIWAGTFKALPPVLRIVLIVSGALTMVFNGANYVRVNRAEKQQ